MKTHNEFIEEVKEKTSITARTKQALSEDAEQKQNESKHPESCECDECELNYRSEIDALRDKNHAKAEKVIMTGCPDEMEDINRDK